MTSSLMMSSLWLLSCIALIFLSSYNYHCAVAAAVESCPCGQLLPRPDLWKKVATARWMAHSLDWGVLSTLSSNNFDGSGIQYPFGNVYSFVDGSCTNATGTPYFYGTYLDQSFQDMKSNPIASFTLTEASLSSSCADISATEFVQAACVITPQYSTNTTFPGDPENPVCARLTMSGTLVEVPEDTDEFTFARNAFYERHPQMQFWPSNHNWKVAKLVLTNLWLIDYFGGATIISPEKYYKDDVIKLAELGY